jgi:hypothetical protein
MSRLGEADQLIAELAGAAVVVEAGIMQSWRFPRPILILHLQMPSSTRWIQ